MKILAIDPGPTKSAYVIWDGDINQILCRSDGAVENERVRSALETYCMNYEVVVIEKVASYGMPVGADVFDTCFESGRFAQEALHINGQNFERIGRHAIKLYFCKTAKAKSANIRQALIDRFGKPGTKNNPGVLYGIKGDHLWAALALAVYYGDIKCGQ